MTYRYDTNAAMLMGVEGDPAQVIPMFVPQATDIEPIPGEDAYRFQAPDIGEIPPFVMYLPQ